MAIENERAHWGTCCYKCVPIREYVSVPLAESPKCEETLFNALANGSIEVAAFNNNNNNNNKPPKYSHRPKQKTHSCPNLQVRTKTPISDASTNVSAENDAFNTKGNQIAVITNKKAPTESEC